jgi:WD40 repeat protein
VSYRESDHIEILFHQPGHLKGVTRIMEIENYIFTGGEDGRICVWDSNLKEEIGCLYAHRLSINDIQKISKEEFLVTASSDLELKIWSLKDFSLVLSKKAHASTIIGSKPWKEFVFSASRDQILKKWKFHDEKLIEEKRMKIPDLDKFFLCDDLIIIIDQHGLMSILKADDFSQIGNNVINKKRLVKAIRKAGKHIKDYENKDPYTVLFNIARRYGIPATTCTKSEEFFILGHQFGLVSIWRRSNHKLSRIFFLHSNHITGIELQENKLITTSLDSSITISNIETGEPLKSVKFSSRPLSLKLSSEAMIITGLESGDILILDFQLKIVRTLPKINSISGSCVTPDFLAVAFNNGEIQLLDNNNLESVVKKKIHDKTPLSISYYKNRIITIGEDKFIYFLDEKLNVTKTIPLSITPTQPKRAKQYIVINSNHVLDLNKDEIMKGEISKETEIELKEVYFPKHIYQNGDLSIQFDKQNLTDSQKKKLLEFYSEDVLLSFEKLAEANKKAKYKKKSELNILHSGI